MALTYNRAWINDGWRYFSDNQITKEFKRGKNKGKVVVQFKHSRSIVAKSDIITYEGE